MKPKPECYDCMRRQAVRSLVLTSRDQNLLEKVKSETEKIIAGSDINGNPPLIATDIFLYVNKITGNPDPYLELKRKYNRIVKDVLRNMAIKDIFSAFKYAINGNIIDFGMQDKVAFNANEDVFLAIDDSVSLAERICQADSILYLCDNAGEIGFDASVISKIKELNPRAKLTASVKSGPVINDALLEDALYFGMDKMCEIIAPAPLYVGTQIDRLDSGFGKLFNDSDVIISKGQANWESLEGIRHKGLFFLLRAKCKVVASSLDVPLGSAVLTKGKE